MKQHLANGCTSIHNAEESEKNNRQIKSCKTRNYQLTHWIATQLNLLINNALI